MSRRRQAAYAAFEALTVEGALLSPAMLARIADRQAGEQADSGYRIPKGLTLRDEVARYYRIAQALFADFAATNTPSTNATIAFVETLLRDVFGFTDIRRVGTRTLDDRLYAVTLEALEGRVPVVVVPPQDALDRASDHLPTDGRRRSAATALQDWLNASPDALWGLCCNGERLRLMRDNHSLTRPAYIEADLRQMLEAEAFADFTALWLLVHASRFGAAGTPPTDCALERWRDAGSREGVAARERLRDGVEAALLALGGGFLSHPANGELRRRVQAGELPLPDYFHQLLRLVYRLIFLLVAEDRGLLHPPEASAAARRLYAEGYSLSALRRRAVRRAAWDNHHDQWEGLRIVFAALARGEKRLGLPALGGLFDPGMMPDLEAASLSNRALMEAIRHLAWLREDSGLVPVNWRDMETEELGSVYEGLLELTPRLAEDGRGFAFAEEALEKRGNARKTTGSYYTPDALVQALLDSALDPVLDRIEAEAEDPAKALLEVTVLDPACGSGHFLLAAARRIATRLARARAGGVASAEDFRHALRDVVRACIHGVDKNPMAVELTKVALWIESVDPGKPLGFLDANIRCGDALLGIDDLEALRLGIPDEAYKPLTGDDKATARHYAKRNKDEKKGQGRLDFAGRGGRLPPPPPVAGAARSLRALPEDDPEQVAQRRRRFERLRNDPRVWHWRVACDLYVAAFLLPKSGRPPANHNTPSVPTTEHVWQALAGHQVHGPLEARAVDIAAQARAFHWPLEFPDVIDAGGFDVVLGNPPWERIKLQEQEFFAAREPEIAAAPNAAARRRLIEALAQAPEGTRQRALFDEFQTARRIAEAASAFARVPGDSGGRFPLTGRGDVNTYALFAELFARRIGPNGRAGIIVPTGIATDATTATFFAALVDSRRLAALVDFENRERIFPAIDSRIKFSLLTIGRDDARGLAAGQPGSQREPLEHQARFVFFLTHPAQMAEAERQFTLTPGDIARINPNTKTAPVFRSRADAELTAKIYARVPVLFDETKGPAGNPWGLSFMRMFDMSNDSGLFRTADDLAKAGYAQDGADWLAPEGVAPPQRPLDLSGGQDDRHLPLLGGGTKRPGRYVPLYEAKMIHQFDHRWATYDGTDARDATSDEKRNPAFEPTPRYWVPAHEVEERLRGKGWSRGWLMGWRDITNATNERTVIATAFPRVGVNHKIPLFFVGHDSAKAAALLADLESLVLDYVARQKVGGTSLTYYYLKQFPILPPAAYSEADLDFIVPRVLELTYTSHAMAPFARDLGYDGPPFPWDEDRRAHLRAELDAFYARAYGLTRDELRYILDPADVKGPDYPSETFRVLKNNEIKRFGEYRTARLVLEAWDRLAAERPAAVTN